MGGIHNKIPKIDEQNEISESDEQDMAGFKYMQCLGDLEGGLPKHVWNYVKFNMPKNTEYIAQIYLKDVNESSLAQQKLTDIEKRVLFIVIPLYQKEAGNVWTNPSLECQIILFQRILIGVMQTYKNSLDKNGIPQDLPKQFTMVNSCCDEPSCSINTLTQALLAALDIVLEKV